MRHRPRIEGEIRCKRCGRTIGLPDLDDTYVLCVDGLVDSYFCEDCQTPEEKRDAKRILAEIETDAQQVHLEFLAVLNELAGVHGLMAGAAIIMQASVKRVVLPHANSPKSMLFLGGGDPSDAAWTYQCWPIHELPDRLGPSGTVARALGRQWVVMVASQWNEHYRSRYARANRMKTFNDPGFADINRMRNDVVHHRGIATPRNTGRCEVFPWFSPDEEIFPTVFHVADFMRHMGGVKRLAEILPPDSNWGAMWGIGERQE